jgi:NADH:ubiquinone oxidoreductase subunit 5 (subunit L)/multisubunit Na+/H+ antiporter MnhA subunit
MGYALLGLAAGTTLGVRGVLIYLAVYVATNIGVFACIQAMRRGGKAVEDISDLSGLARTDLKLAVLFAMLFLSLAGLPPLAGFVGKFYIFLAAIQAGLIWPSVIGVLASTIGLVYYLRRTAIMFFNEPAPALDKARANVALNGFDAARHEALDADVNAFLRQQLQAGATFDAIVLDPPKFAPTASHAERAARAYKDINRLALKLLAPGGLLLTFSCSGGVGAELFHKIVAGAAADAGVDGAILQRLEGAPDHPTTLVFPEGEYLKGLAVLRAA